jgi:hypothetical protein
MPRKTISIASAPGWKARFLVEEDEVEGVRVVQLTSWALVQDSDGGTEIVGVVQRAATPAAPRGWLGFADEVDGFQGYTFAGPTNQAPQS